jgi:hypothetical protein
MYRLMSVDATLTAEPASLPDGAKHVDDTSGGRDFISRPNSRFAVR